MKRTSVRCRSVFDGVICSAGQWAAASETRQEVRHVRNGRNPHGHSFLWPNPHVPLQPPCFTPARLLNISAPDFKLHNTIPFSGHSTSPGPHAGWLLHLAEPRHVPNAGLLGSVVIQTSQTSEQQACHAKESHLIGPRKIAPAGLLVLTSGPQ